MVTSKSYCQYTEKQLKRLDRIGIRAYIYEQEVNKSIVLKILEVDRSHPKTLIPGIILSALSASFFVALTNYDNDNPAVIAPLVAITAVTGGGSLSLYTVTIVKRTRRNNLIRHLKKSTKDAGH